MGFGNIVSDALNIMRDDEQEALVAIENFLVCE